MASVLLSVAITGKRIFMLEDHPMGSNEVLLPNTMEHGHNLCHLMSTSRHSHSQEFLPNVYSKPALCQFQAIIPCPINTNTVKSPSPAFLWPPSGTVSLLSL